MILESDKNDLDDIYKEIVIEFPKELNLREQSILNNLFHQFEKEEVTYQIIGNEIVIFLNSLDFDNFKEILKKEITSESTSNLSELLGLIIQKIESIKSYGIKGKKRIYSGYDKERKVKDRKQKELSRNQFYYANANNFSEVNNLFPTEFIDRIFCADSYELLKKFPDNCIDLIFTSPPYNFGLEYSSNNDAHKWENYFDKLFQIFDECIRVLKYGGRIIINVQPLFSDYVPTHHIISNYFMNKKLIWKGEILWEKNNYNCKYTAWGSWKSPSNPYLKYTWEFLEIFSKGTLKKEGKREDIDISADEFKNWIISRWSVAPERNMKNYEHPAMFPEELARRVLKLFSFKEDIILDPFNGVGTTSYVAKTTNRKFIGIDISCKYCEIAQKRIDGILL